LDYNGYPLSGNVQGQPGVAQYAEIGQVYIYQVLFPTSGWSIQYLVNMAEVKDVAVIQRATNFESAGVEVVRSINENLPGFTGSNPVRLDGFGSEQRFYIDSSGLISAVNIDPDTGDQETTTPNWSSTLALHDSISIETQLGHFKDAGLVPPPPPLLALRRAR
jgi:hypothetical protein